MEKNFPTIIWVFVIGEEYNKRIDPLLNSLLTKLMVNKGI